MEAILTLDLESDHLSVFPALLSCASCVMMASLYLPS